jgi:3-isopropylmalate/(R)-2-methylmalate dehydratase small subunit
MKPFHIERGIVAPLPRTDVDTDQIIPKQFLKRIERTGFGESLFHDWRSDPEFVLNAPRYRDATILVTGRNFGCGSSREHAAWALLDHGFRAIVAPSFADIFATNAAANGILLITLASSIVEEITRRATIVDRYELTIDLERSEVRDDHALSYGFEIDPFRRHRLLNGLDAIELTLRFEAQIAAYERRNS